MARKAQKLDAGIFKKTAPEPTKQAAPKVPAATRPEPDDELVPAEGRTISTGVGLKRSELDLLDRIAANHGVARNFIMRWMLRRSLGEYLSGALPEPPRRLP